MKCRLSIEVHPTVWNLNWKVPFVVVHSGLVPVPMLTQ